MARLSVQLFDELVISYGAGEERKGKCFIVSIFAQVTVVKILAFSIC